MMHGNRERKIINRCDWTGRETGVVFASESGEFRVDCIEGYDFCLEDSSGERRESWVIRGSGWPNDYSLGKVYAIGSGFVAVSECGTYEREGLCPYEAAAQLLCMTI